MKMLRLALRGMLLLFLFFSLLFCGDECAAGSQIKKQELQSGARLDRAKTEAAAYTFRNYNRFLSENKAQEYAKYVMEASARYSVDPSLITAIIIKESTAKANARSKYAVGLMQVYWNLHKKTIMAQFPHIKTEKILMEPRNNIMVGTWLFSRYMINCRGDESKALRRYLGSHGTMYIAKITRYRSNFSKRVSFNLRSAAKRSA